MIERTTMELTVIGCSGSLSGPESPASCYLVRAPYQGRTFSLVVDLGPGALGALFSVIDPQRVDAIAISHLHPDHCLDLCGFHVAAQHAPTAPWSPIDLYGPPGTLDRIARSYDPSPDGTEPDDLTTTFAFHGWEPEQRIGPFTVGIALMAHPVPAYGMRIGTGAATLAYSADTGPTEALTRLADGADLLLCEASFLDGGEHPAGLHLTGRQAAEHAAAAGVSELMITHVPPWHDRDRVRSEAEPHFTGPITLARRGLTWAPRP